MAIGKGRHAMPPGGTTPAGDDSAVGHGSPCTVHVKQWPRRQAPGTQIKWSIVLQERAGRQGKMSGRAKGCPGLADDRRFSKSKLSG